MIEKSVAVIIPVMNEEKQIPKTLEVIDSIIKKVVSNYKFIIVDDGSTDSTWEVISRLSFSYSIEALRFSRNFGKESAISAGIESFNGDACIVMDADLQHPPELIPEMLRLWYEEGYEVVHCVKSSRGKESSIHKICCNTFYKVMNKLSGIDMQNASDYKLLDSKVVESYKLFKENKIFFRGISKWVGYKNISIPFEVAPRTIGTSKWTFSKLTNLALNAITSFSSIPLQIVTFLGALLFIGSLILSIQTLYNKISGKAVSGFTTTILLLLIIGSTIMVSLGIIGTYIAKIYEEIKARPRYIVAEKLLKKDV